jgi:hypothetical protein
MASLALSADPSLRSQSIIQKPIRRALARPSLFRSARSLVRSSKPAHAGKIALVIDAIVNPHGAIIAPTAAPLSVGGWETQLCPAISSTSKITVRLLMLWEPSFPI